jgi:light-regulated signal transduction histidine kinase (bacteriophytochrome)
VGADQEQNFAVDITNCDREPIHVLGTIQPFGFLIAVSSDWLVSRASRNTQDHIGIPHHEMLGKPLPDFFLPEAVHAIRNRMMLLRDPDAIERLFSISLREDRPAFDVAVHFSGSSVVIEAEPAAGNESEAGHMVRSMIARLRKADSMPAFLRDGARHVRALTGFDRVMVYRFDRTGSGEVAAEALRAGVDSFLGLNYPASDIPSQARALYLRNPFRIIADVRSQPVPIDPGLDPSGTALDQSLCILRAVSPIHIEYLRNMGVEASLSISIIIEGKLWGLFACHHYKPRLPSFAERSAAELFGQMFSLMLESRERAEAAEYETRARMVADRLMATVAQNNELLADAQWLGEIIFDTIQADGVGVFIDGRISLAGLAPDENQFSQVVRALNGVASGQVFTTDQISSLVPGAEAYASRAAGLLAIPLSRSPRDYVVLFRGERLRSVRWAGDPDKKDIEYGPNGPRLTPRKSFEEWSDLVRGKALPFTAAELRMGETLRTALLEVVLRLSESAGQERRRAHEQQELLIAELNHRVRNILSLIRGLISQTRQSHLSADAFIETLDDRVQALARAHDQITADRWGPARLYDLIETEAGAYLGERRDRIKASGPNVLLEPGAFTVLALVIHELMTNAAKYGALADSGTVAISWIVDADGSLLMSWKESGGPAVTAPTRRGFGSTIIERSIPYDLHGKAEINYRLMGLEAEFCIPSRCVSGVLPDVAGSGTAMSEASATGYVLAGRTVLLVEDNMIIALDSEDALHALGAKQVLTASSNARAATLVADGRIDFAILDFNLGFETSLPVADLLQRKNIPFVFATGYGDGLDLPKDLADVALLKKPFNKDTLGAAIAAAGPKWAAPNA